MTNLIMVEHLREALYVVEDEDVVVHVLLLVDQYEARLLHKNQINKSMKNEHILPDPRF